MGGMCISYVIFRYCFESVLLRLAFTTEPSCYLGSICSSVTDVGAIIDLTAEREAHTEGRTKSA